MVPSELEVSEKYQGHSSSNETRVGTLTTNTQSILYHLKSIWLFTRSDVITIIVPESIFGTMNAIAAQTFNIESPQTAKILHRVILVVFWTWINLLPLAIDNQRRPVAILEDSFNKPWRPLPSKRLSARRAQQLMYTLWLVALLASLYLGGLRQSITLIFLSYCYNEFNGGDSNCITRNLLNACGFLSYSSGAMEVALGSPVPFTPKFFQWLLVIGGVVFSTIHTQDLYDQEGDGLRNRRTVPLVLGDSLTRILTVIPMVFWPIFVPWIWDSHFLVYTASMGMGVRIIIRMLTKRSVGDDKRTFVWWNVWLVFIYSIPLLNSFRIDNY